MIYRVQVRINTALNEVHVINRGDSKHISLSDDGIINHTNAESGVWEEVKETDTSIYDDCIWVKVEVEVLPDD